jgi:hypothetical protein
MTKRYVLLSLALLPSALLAQEEKKPSKSLGIDSTEIIGKIGVDYSYFDKEDGTQRHSALLGFDKELSKTTKLGLRIPYTFAETKAGDKEQGLGDIGFNIGNRFYHSESFSALAGVRATLDTAAEDILGDGNHKASLGGALSWRKGKWLKTLAGGFTASEDKDDNAVNLSPLLGYQPMGKYISYITFGLSSSYKTESSDFITGLTVFGGKVLPNQDIFAFGTRISIDGPDDNKTVVFLSYRRLY